MRRWFHRHWKEFAMKLPHILFGLGCALAAFATCGCQSPHRSDQGALFGGLTGAGVGALVGEAVGKPLAGAAIGAGVGTLTGSTVGGALDDIEAKNQAEIAARMGHPPGPGSVTIQDVVSMSQSGVSPEIIANHVQIHGPARVLQTADLIYLKNSGVQDGVIHAMQQTPVRPPSQVAAAPAPVVVEEHHHYDPWGPFPHGHYRHHRRHRRQHHHPGVTWGLSFSN
jgi:hypothetical protein